MPNIVARAGSVGAMLLGIGVAAAQEIGWSAGYQMGTSWAGVSSAQGARLTVYCGDSAAAQANPAITGGPYLTASLPRMPTLETIRSLEIVINGRAVAIPVVPQADGEAVDMTWKPSGGFDVSRMKPVLAAMRKASRIELRAGGHSAVLPTDGAGKALADDPLGCR